MSINTLLSTNGAGTALILGAAAILAYYAYGKFAGAGRAEKRPITAPTGDSLSARMAKVMRFLRHFQVDGSIDVALHKHYNTWATEVIRADGPTGSTGMGVLDGEEVGKAPSIDMTAAEIALTLLEGLGYTTQAPEGKVTSSYTYTNDMALPPALTDEVVQGIPPMASTKAAVDAFTIAEAYFDLCQTRRVAATEGKVPDEAVYAELLQRLWASSFSGEGGTSAPVAQPAYERQGPGWGELGFQGQDPITDLRGGGVMSLEDYVAFAEDNKALHKAMVEYNRNQHAISGPAWFLEACVSIQLSVQLTTTAFDPRAPSPTTAVGGGLLKKRVNNAAPVANTSPLRFTPAIAKYLYTGPAAETRARLQRLHALYFRAFFALWQREKPFIMEYQNFMTKVYFLESPLLVEGYLTA